MKLIRTFIASGLAAALVVGCSEKTTLGPDATNEEIQNALVGSWTASSIVVTNNANPSQTVDVMAMGGSVTLTMTAEGTYTGTFSGPGENDSFSGTYVVNGLTLTLTEQGEPEPDVVVFALQNGVLTLTMDESWDFDQDGTDEDATMVIQLQK